MKTIKVNGNTLDWEEGLTVRGVLHKMNYSFRMLVIKIDGKLIKKDEYDSTPVPEGADVMVMHLISGG
ncbi:MAG: sulfur carrier protein ThiS [Candidatus Cloacimonadaceae bacterium]|nr:sulfur carrier protein ThiS [Candidatus Cloacimonadaceae bacterium]